ncbi:MAG: hypothetical protein ACRD2X_22560 [Vicinamibacteraceae bacterium]
MRAGGAKIRPIHDRRARLSRSHVVVATRIDKTEFESRDDYIAALIDREIEAEDTDGCAVTFTPDLDEGHAVMKEHVHAYVLEQLEALHADIVLVSTDPLNTVIDNLRRAGRECRVHRCPCRRSCSGYGR